MPRCFFIYPCVGLGSFWLDRFTQAPEVQSRTVVPHSHWHTDRRQTHIESGNPSRHQPTSCWTGQRQHPGYDSTVAQQAMWFRSSGATAALSEARPLSLWFASYLCASFIKTRNSPFLLHARVKECRSAHAEFPRARNSVHGRGGGVIALACRLCRRWHSDRQVQFIKGGFLLARATGKIRQILKRKIIVDQCK